MFILNYLGFNKKMNLMKNENICNQNIFMIENLQNIIFFMYDFMITLFIF